MIVDQFSQQNQFFELKFKESLTELLNTKQEEPSSPATIQLQRDLDVLKF